MSAPSGKAAYVSGGHVLANPPLSARIVRFFDHIYYFLGLYFVTLFSLDPYSAAQNSQFNVNRCQNKHNLRPRWGGGRYGGGGGPGGDGGSGGSGPRGGGGGPRKIGRVDDIRGPECGSCQ